LTELVRERYLNRPSRSEKLVALRYRVSRDVRADGPVHGQQAGLPAGRQPGAELLDDRRLAGDVAGVVEDRIAEQDDVAHGAASAGVPEL
jgi:hypothetical protein